MGHVTTARAEAVGSSRKAIGRLAQSGLLVRFTQGVYRLVGAPATGCGGPSPQRA
ncbi:type IV toxin-antitoxin system AbiEi family antitoxin domain-containing protein [Kribbella italica]|uniref:type IV toxin-antitoxin system AbiEi family antitoxin domain-containing protein n=1 Tax=Kribbella italica TaxID=1540520 RepID=UPI00192DF8D7